MVNNLLLFLRKKPGPELLSDSSLNGYSNQQMFFKLLFEGFSGQRLQRGHRAVERRIRI